MRKILIFFVCIFLWINISYSRDIYEKELPSLFKKECFEYSASYTFGGKNQGEYKIKLNKSDAIAVRNEYLVPIIPYRILGDKYSYSTETFSQTIRLNDDNLQTGLEIDTGKTTEIVLDFDEVIKRNSFSLNFKHSARDYIPELAVSEDGKVFSAVTFQSLYDFDIKILKISFTPRSNDVKREKIKIFELSFTKEERINLIRVQGGGKVDFYSSYKCDDYVNLDTIHVSFPIDSKTPEVEVKLEKSSFYNPNIEKDSDGDNIENDIDNCISVYNPLQLDSNADGKGDRCSDVDNDGFIGHKDNCPTISNPDQVDINLNNVGDVCEFDKDNDGIFDSEDNCITVMNAFQYDDDHDGIGNLCDNCKSFNPGQIDKDENGIGDVCDKNNKELAEHDDDLDLIINGADNCPAISNPEQEDSDEDGIGDACDNCREIKNPEQFDFDENGVGDICEDSDGDGIEGMKDNCINVANKDQSDKDNDGIGDLCEDEDNDSILFAHDNCPYDYNPFQKDVDEDSLGDKCDESDDRILESNKELFIVILVIVSLFFGAGIYFMVEKLKGKDAKSKNKKNKNSKKKKKNGDEMKELFESYTESKRHK